MTDAAPRYTNEQAALEVLKALRQAGHVAYFAGGCVRDRLLGLTPKDHDVATSADPVIVRKLFRQTQAVGAAFGVILVRCMGHQVEVATFRTDGSYTDGRRPDAVEFASPEQDARRRDFTINGLFYDPLEDRVIDFVGGQQDLDERKLRAIGDPEARLAEDHLRLLRAVRFAARFDFKLDPPTAAALRGNAPKLRNISPERVGDELRRMMSAPTRNRAFALLRELGLLAELFRFFPGADVHKADLFNAVAPGEKVAFSLSLVAAALDDGLEAGGDNGLDVLLSPDRRDATARGLRRALRLSNDESAEVEEILASTAELVLTDPVPLARRRRFLARATSRDTLLLLQGMVRSGVAGARVATLVEELLPLAGQNHAPPPLLTGDDLVASGLSPGPVFKAVLEAVYDAQLENRVNTRTDAAAFATAWLRDRPQGTSVRSTKH